MTFDVRMLLVTTIGMLNPGIACSRKNKIMRLPSEVTILSPKNVNMNMRQSVAISACRVHGLLHGDIIRFPTRAILSIDAPWAVGSPLGYSVSLVCAVKKYRTDIT